MTRKQEKKINQIMLTVVFITGFVFVNVIANLMG